MWLSFELKINQKSVRAFATLARTCGWRHAKVDTTYAAVWRRCAADG
ncbi:MAG: hypothetical protein ACYDC3_06205 [Candidatus Binataceae bacterium]